MVALLPSAFVALNLFANLATLAAVINDSAACRNLTPAAPLATDCNTLQNGSFALANLAVAFAPPPCNNPQNCNCPNFSVQPGFQQPSLQGLAPALWSILSLKPGSIPPLMHLPTIWSIFNVCVNAQHTTGGVAVPATASGQAVRFIIA
ncbi:hypothetical protein ONZ45_g17018 [Pleurotus djamor]|nr:hypothetical protein ONZ45_g17018 [Pleurotus djamor]